MVTSDCWQNVAAYVIQVLVRRMCGELVKSKTFTPDQGLYSSLHVPNIAQV